MLATASQDPGCHEGVGDPGGSLRTAECPGGSGCDRREDGDPDRPADLVAGRVEAGDHPRLVLAGAGEDRDRDRDDGDAEPEPGDEHPGQDVAEIGAVLADVREQRHAGGGDRERRRERHPHAVTADDVAGGVSADPGRERERDEREAGHERAGAEHVLEVERAEQEEAEDRACCDEHQEEPTADGAIGEPFDAQKRLLGPALPDREGGEPSEADAVASPIVWVEPQPALVRLRDRVDECAEARGGEERAGQVEAPPARLAGVAGMTLSAVTASASGDREVDVEDQPPVGHLGEKRRRRGRRSRRRHRRPRPRPRAPSPAGCPGRRS